jgi:hypothetical protein
VKYLLIVSALLASGCDRQTVTLDKREWRCTRHMTRTLMVSQVAGRTTVVRPERVTQCDVWERRLEPQS